MSRPDEGFSRRAKVLERVLDWVNQERYEDYDTWMLFGSMGADTGGKLTALYPRGPANKEELHGMVSGTKVAVGRVMDLRRTSLEAKPPTFDIPGLGEVKAHQEWRAERATNPEDVYEYLDCAYAKEIVGKLERIMERASTTLFAPHEVNADQIGDLNVRSYFQEAHRCYLYGFSAACAVMCRAAVESALKRKYDPDETIAQRNTGGALIDELLSVSKLQEPLPRWGKCIWKLGGFAAHDYQAFLRKLRAPKKIVQSNLSQDDDECYTLEEILAKTKSILETIFPQSAES